MLITYYGHSQFLLEGEDGYRLFTDPSEIGYPMCEDAVDCATGSHGHHDHNAVGSLQGAPRVIDRAGEYGVSRGVTVTAIDSVHDERGGALRGNNLIIRIDMDGLSIVHLGDQGDQLTEAQVKALGRVDVLLIPVGGYYTVDAVGAAAIARALNPAVILPMHYKTAVTNDWAIADERAFLSLMGAASLAPSPVLRVTKEDLCEQPPVFLLDWRKTT